MPLFNTNETTTPVAPTTSPNTVIGTASIYTQVGNIDKIVAYIEGSPWPTNYYSQYLGEDDTVNNSSDINDPTLRQLLKIEGFELKVTSPLDFQTDPDTQLSTLNGSANVYPYITPTVGDNFIANIETDVYGIFEVTAVKRLSYLKNSAWEIEYSLLDYASAELLEELDGFVVNIVGFDVSMIGTTKGPLASRSVIDQNISRKEAIKKLITEFYLRYMDSRFQTFMINGVSDEYDDHVVSFMNKIMRSEDMSDKQRPKEYSARIGAIKRPYYTVYDALFLNSNTHLRNAVRHMSPLNVSQLATDRIYHSIIHSGIETTIQPDVVEGLAVITGDSSKPYYAVSELFYDHGTITDPLELLLSKYFNQVTVTYSELSPVIDLVQSESDQLFFYRAPIIIALLYIARG